MHNMAVPAYESFRPLRPFGPFRPSIHHMPSAAYQSFPAPCGAFLRSYVPNHGYVGVSHRQDNRIVIMPQCGTLKR